MAKGAIIQIKGIRELRRRVKVIPQNVANGVDAEMAASANDYANLAIEAAPRDEGILIQGISANRNALMDHEVVSASPYSPYVEFGTRRRVSVPSDLQDYAAQFKGNGGGTGEGFYDHILGWVKRKGIRYDSAATVKTGKKKGQAKKLSFEQTAWIIYFFLLYQGVRPQPYFFQHREPIMKALMKKLEPTIQKALQ